MTGSRKQPVARTDDHLLKAEANDGQTYDFIAQADDAH
jgi:hypothetical protein